MMGELNLEKTLDCANCILSPSAGRMCPTVASRAARRMLTEPQPEPEVADEPELPEIEVAINPGLEPEVGIDQGAPADIVQSQLNNKRVLEIAADECHQRKLEQASVRAGYKPLTY